MKKLSFRSLFSDFFESGRAGGFILILCTFVSVLVSNSSFGASYSYFWHALIGGKPIEFWINDGLMTIFFLMVGLEIEREFYNGELSDIKKSMLPVLAALGGMLIPAAIHYSLNNGNIYQCGFGIPMATDIAFSLAVLSLLGNRVPLALKVFLTALAIIDDLGAIVVIALFYSTQFSWMYFGFAMLCFGVLLVLNRLNRSEKWPYILIGGIMWVCMYKSGIHPTITGVLLAFAFPFGKGDENSPSIQLQTALHKPVSYLILPLFALANTVVVFPKQLGFEILNNNVLGVALGLLIGKPLGVLGFCWLAVKLKWVQLSEDLNLKIIFGAGLLAGIGFTMSVFIALLAFQESSTINLTKISILIASLVSGCLGYFYLRQYLRR
jgi:Na+:H+ antiporter, NhaA family